MRYGRGAARSAWRSEPSGASGKRDMATESFRLRPVMRQGSAPSIPETWEHYASIEDARAGAKQMYHADRVLRVMVVVDSLGSFVEWIER